MGMKEAFEAALGPVSDSVRARRRSSSSSGGGGGGSGVRRTPQQQYAEEFEEGELM